MSLIDEILEESSKSVFSQLDDDDYRILKILARNGSMNITEIGSKTKGYAASFDRWGVKRRLDGSMHFVGLVPNQYVYQIEVNKKETKYGLSLKGLLAILSEIKFEQIDIVKRYKRLLRKHNRDKNLLNWAFDFIKYEIALILFVNSVKGFDWTKLKIVRQYWDNFKSYDHKIIQEFFVFDYTFMDREDLRLFESIKKNYLTLFFILDELTYTIELGVTREYYEDKYESGENFRQLVDGWYNVIDVYNIKKRKLGFELSRDDNLPYYDEEFWIEERKKPKREAYRILREKGYQ